MTSLISSVLTRFSYYRGPCFPGRKARAPQTTDLWGENLSISVEAGEVVNEVIRRNQEGT